MKQLNITSLLIVLLSMIGLNASAHDIEVKNGGGVTIYYNYINDNTELEVTYRGTYVFDYLNEYTGNVVIPESVTYDNKIYSVTRIGDSAFDNCSGLTSITIPNSVTSIGDHVFSVCSGLTSVTIPNSVTRIGRSAFQYCSRLTSIDIPNSVTSIGGWAFDGCSKLTSVTIGNSVTSIGIYVFSDCSALTSIKVASGNTKYDSRDNCNAIIETASNTLITGCMNTTIPNSVTSIGENAFKGCSGLTSITIPNSVTSIGDWAFNNCSGLTSITIPNSVTSIEDDTFNGCSKLNNVYNESTTPQKFSDEPYFNYSTATLHVPAGTKELYQAADYWKNFSKIVEDINTVIVEDDKEPATTVEGEEFYNLVLDKETVEFAEIISANEAGKGRIAIKDGGLLIVKGDDVRFALSEIKKGDILVFDFVGKIRCLYGTLTANSAQQNSFPQVTSDEMELESGKEYIANEDCDVVLEMETAEALVELKSITITEPTGVSIVETSTNQSISGKTYNLAGQQVSVGSKGLLIQDGKKVIK